MKNYKVTVRTPGKILIINGMQIRTPSVFYINENELNSYKQKFSLQGINKYTFELVKENVVETKSIRIITNSKEEEQKYEEEEKPKTILESYLD